MTSNKLFGDRKSLASTTVYGEGRASDTDFTAMAISSIKIALMICGLATCLTTDELRRAHFNQLDLDQNGSLSTAEYYAFSDKMDTNKDGALTVTEFTGIADENLVPEFIKLDFRVYDGFDGAVDGLIQRSAVPDLVRNLDTNGDGAVGFEEGLAVLKRHLGETK